MQNDKYDLAIIGGGSAAFAGAIAAAEMGRTVAMIERGTVGGTCVNVGCVPSKTLIRAAEAKFRAEGSNFTGIEPGGVKFDFATLIAEKDKLVAGLRQAKYKDVLTAHAEISFIKGAASFVNENTVKVGERIIQGNYFLIATGASPYAPPIPGLDQVPYLTSTTAFELKELPESLAIIGGRYIALELAQMFGRLGSKVTVLQRSNSILPTEDSDLRRDLTEYLTAEGIVINTGVDLAHISHGDDFIIDYKRGGAAKSLAVNQLIVATGRRPNTSGLNLAAVGVNIGSGGAIAINEYNQTSQPHIYAAGDVIGAPAFVYTAASEGKMAINNAFNGNEQAKDNSLVPYVVFTDPQVAGVGLSEQAAAAQGIEIEVAKLSLNNVPRALAARDTRGFIKLIKEKGSDYLAGAVILAPEGGELLMEVTLAIKYKIPLPEIVAMFHPYLTLGEGIKLTAQTFDKDVKTLSCCAS